MKRIILLFILSGLVSSLFAQEPDSSTVTVGNKNIVTVTTDDNNVNVKVFDDDFVVVDERDDTVKIKIGNKGLSVIETDKGTHVEIIDMEDFEDHGWKRRKERFRGHWAGYELGMNNFTDRYGKFAGSIPGTEYMDLNTGKSWNANINFLQYSLPMGSSVGWVTGMGFEWNNYYFDRNNVIGKDPATGRIIPIYPPAGAAYSKAKMNTTYFTVPLLLEFQFGHKKKGFLSMGVIGGLKLHSNILQKYNDNGNKERIKTKNDLNLSPLRAAGTVRVGYKFIKLFANVGLIPLFKDNLGPVGSPDLYPVTIGLIFFNIR